MDCPPKRAQLKAPGGRDLDSGSDNVTGEQWTGEHCGHSTVFAYCQPQNLAQIWTFYRYTLTIIWLGAVSLLYNHFLGCFTPLGG